MVLVAYKLIILVDCIAMVMHFLHAGQEHKTLPCTEEPMITLDFITDLFCQVDDQLPGIPKHPHATLWLNRFKGYAFLVAHIPPPFSQC